MDILNDILVALAAWKEAATRPGIMSRDGWKLVVSFRQGLSMYFNHMASQMKVDGAVAEHNYSVLEPLLLKTVDTSQKLLLSTYSAHAQKAFLLSGKKSVLTVKEADDGASADLPKDELYAQLDKLGLTGKQAVDYVNAHGAKLIKELDAYTLLVMRSLIAKGIEEQLGVQGTVRLIREEFEHMGRVRAKSIATTEMNDAMSEAALVKIQAVGLDGKRWIRSAGACPICTANAAQGIIPVSQPFQSGHQRPPGHPGKCRCAVAGARLPIAA